MTAWISRVDPVAPADGPLRGLTFAIKDNIDLAGVPTTAGDPRNETPAATNAHVVELLLAAGAVPVGKTNLDQYATGLVGTRSPYGACSSVFSESHVAGGSSSGSALVVAREEVDFALATDTAGSGRVPAAFNGLIGIKPTRGLVSTRGVFPACRSLDCVTVLARSVDLAHRVMEVIGAYDPADPFARQVGQTPRRSGGAVIGVPAGDLDLDPNHDAAWKESLAEAGKLGRLVAVDVSALLETATLLYDGPWLAERWLAFGDRLDDQPCVDPVVRTVVTPGREITAESAFAGFHRLATQARRTEDLWAQVDALLLPVTPGHPTLAEVRNDPLGVNARLGRFTNMTNLLDLCAIAFPGPSRSDGLPFGLQLLAPAGGDWILADLAARWCGETPPSPPPPEASILVAVAGAHLSGQPLNDQLTTRQGELVATTRTAAGYRMFLVDGPLPRPGLTRTLGHGAGPGIEVEVWRLPLTELGSLVASVLPPLAIGPLDLEDGTSVLGFVCTADAADPTRELTAYGGWRAYLGS